jgi:bifunctional enzyme CysN/CysC
MNRQTNFKTLMPNKATQQTHLLHPQLASLTRSQREKIKNQKGKVIWFTGLSGSGKTTLANALEVELHSAGRHTYILDGDNIRSGLNHDLGFSDDDRAENIRRTAEVAKLMMDAGLIVICAFISPFQRERQMARQLIGSADFAEIYVNTPLAICEQRDVKRLYKKARAGVIPNMTGISSRYEPPENAELEIDTQRNSIEESVKVLKFSLKL